MSSFANRLIQRPRMLAVVMLGIVLASPLCVGPARAREVETVPRGARIRAFLTVPDARPIVGSLMSLEGDTLVITAEPDTHKVALLLGSVRTLEISQGRESHKGAYAVTGILVGGGVGALIGSATYDPNTDIGLGRSFSAMGGALLGAIVGLRIGTIVGSKESERWVPLDPAAIHLTWQPAAGGGTVLASIHF